MYQSTIFRSLLIMVMLGSLALIARPDKPAAVPAEFKSGITQAVQLYFELEKTVFDADLEQAAAKAKELSQAVAAVSTEGLNEELQAEWKEQAQKIREATGRLSSPEEADSLRGEFLNISNAFIDILKHFGPLDKPVYLYHCPMAMNTGGHWLSKDKDIANPYLGKEMSGCGTLVETYEAQN